MNLKRNILRPAFLALLVLTHTAGRAVPAKPGLHTYSMPDGSAVTVSLVGDEYSHYYLSSDGFMLVPADDGTLQFATQDSRGDIVSSGVKACDPAARARSQQDFLRGIDREAVIAKMASQYSDLRHKAPKRISTGMVTPYPTTGRPKALVLLVEFQDVKFSVDNPQKAFTELMCKEGYDFNGATGSVTDYYSANSSGAFEPEFEVYGPVTLPEPEIYYGQESGMMYDVQGWLMARDGVVALHEKYPGLDFSRYDNDKDGFVDNVFIFYAGYGQNEGGPSWAIWPHSAQLWSMYSIDISFNGVKVDKYACTNELKGTQGTTLCGIGTFVHEFNHILGLMDHYPTTLANRECSPGVWDVMDQGSYNNDGRTPPHLSAFERYSLRWLNPRKLTGPENISLAPLHTSNEALLIDTEKPEEFFLLENRQRDVWDAALPGHGLLVWHIDYDKTLWNENNINNEYSHQRVDLVEADNLMGTGSRPGDPFPGTNNVHAFTSATIPAMITWIGVDPDMPLTEIYEVEGAVTMKVKGGGVAVEAPVSAEATDVGPTGFTANWQLVPGINRYSLDVCRDAEMVPFLTVDVEQATSYAVTGLTPSTGYTYVVRSCDGDRMSADSRRVSVTTLSPTLDMLRPTALEAAAVDGDGFTACWEKVSGAEGYVLDVYRKKEVDPQAESLNFADGVDLPDGWSTNCTSTGSLAGYTGQAAPALRMNLDNDRLVTPDFPGGINSFSFWYRGNSTKDDASLTVESMTAGTWTPVYTIKPVVKTRGVTVCLGGADADAKLPSGTTRLRIVFNKESSGSLYIDDVVLAHDASFEHEYVRGYEKYDVADVTSAKVAGLEKSTRYHYVVYAYDGGVRSLPSNEIEVITAETVAVGSVIQDTPSITTSHGELTVEVAADTRMALYTLEGVTIHKGSLRGGRPLTLGLAPGIYLLSLDGKVH